MMINSTNKTFKLCRGCVVGKAECIQSENITILTERPPKVNEISGSDLLANVNIPPEHRKRVLTFLRLNFDFFAQKDTDVGQTDTVTMSIDTGYHELIKLRLYRVALNNRKLIYRAIDEMLEAKIIERSNSPWSFLCLLISKKDSSHWFCVDFRKLNQVTKSNSFLLPIIDDILAQLGVQSTSPPWT